MIKKHIEEKLHMERRYPLSVRLTPENKERMKLINNYFNSDRYPNDAISINKAINICIEVFYNLFVENGPNVTPKMFYESLHQYQNIRDNRESMLMTKLNRLDQQLSENKYIEMQLFKRLVINAEERKNDITSIYSKGSFENEFEKILRSLVQQDRNYSYNMKHKMRKTK